MQHNTPLPESDHASLATVRFLLRNWADERVHEEEQKFLQYYHVSPLTQDEEERHLALIGKKFDQLLQQELDDLFPQKLSTQEQAAVAQLQAIAQPIWKSHGKQLTIIHKGGFMLEDIGIAHHDASNSSYLYINAIEHVQYPEQFYEIALHEYAHIFFDDMRTKFFLIGRAWSGPESAESPEAITEQLNTLSQCMEIRADVYAATNSPAHGRHAIEFHKRCSKEVPPTHPPQDERIRMLIHINAALQAADGAQSAPVLP